MGATVSMISGAKKIKVLVLDDEIGFLNKFREFLQGREGLEAEYVSSPAKALELVADGDYQVVVSDNSLPGIDGMQFLRALRSLHCRAPSVLLTGDGRESLAIEAVQNGADFYMEKAGSPGSMFEQLACTIRALGEEGRMRIRDCLPEPFQVFSKDGTLFLSNGGERVLAAAVR